MHEAQPLVAGSDLASVLSQGGMAGSFLLDFPAQDTPGRSLSRRANDITAWLQLGLKSRSFSHGTMTSVLVSGAWFPAMTCHTSGAVC